MNQAEKLQELVRHLGQEITVHRKVRFFGGSINLWVTSWLLIEEYPDSWKVLLVPHKTGRSQEEDLDGPTKAIAADFRKNDGGLIDSWACAMPGSLMRVHRNGAEAASIYKKVRTAIDSTHKSIQDATRVTDAHA